MELLGFDQLLDISFVVLVTACCWLSLSASSNRGENKTREWKNELEQLRRSLELLINEAGTASRNLDKNLAQRQEQLTELLARIESSQRVAQAADLPPAQPHLSQPTVDSQSLNTQTSREAAAEAVQEFDPDTPNPSWERSEPRESTASDSAASLRQQIEVSKGNDIESAKPQKREVIVKRKLSIDPLAERVAKRLLLRGQEIHIVARKLDLSLSVVRVLDKELRETNPEYRGGEEDDFQTLEPADEIYSAESDDAIELRGRG